LKLTRIEDRLTPSGGILGAPPDTPEKAGSG